VFATEDLTIFAQNGHLVNIHDPKVRMIVSG